MTHNFRINELPPVSDGDVVYLANSIIVSADGDMPVQKATVLDATIGDYLRQAPQVYEWSDLDQEPTSIPWSIGVDRTQVFTREEVVSAVSDFDPTIDFTTTSVDELLLKPATKPLVSKALGTTLLDRMVSERTYEV